MTTQLDTTPSSQDLGQSELLPFTFDAAPLLATSTPADTVGAGPTATVVDEASTTAFPLAVNQVQIGASPSTTLANGAVVVWLDGSKLTIGKVYRCSAVFTATPSGKRWEMGVDINSVR